MAVAAAIKNNVPMEKATNSAPSQLVSAFMWAPPAGGRNRERPSYFFFFKQKTAYEMVMSDWSSDVCSSDLGSSHPQCSRACDEPRLPRRACRPGVGEAVAENRRNAHAARTAFLDRALDRITRRHDESVVDRAGCLGEAAPGALAEHFAARRVDRDDASRVAVLAQEAQGARTVLRRVAGCTDERDRARPEQGLRERHGRGSRSSFHSLARSARACSSPSTGEASSKYLCSSSASESGRSGSPLRVGWRCSPRRPSRDSIATRAARCAGNAASRSGSRAISTRRISERVAASPSRAGSNAASRTLP